MEKTELAPEEPLPEETAVEPGTTTEDGPGGGEAPADIVPVDEPEPEAPSAGEGEEPQEGQEQQEAARADVPPTGTEEPAGGTGSREAEAPCEAAGTAQEENGAAAAGERLEAAPEDEQVTVELGLPAPQETVSAEQLFIDAEDRSRDADEYLRGLLEAVIYVTDEPLSPAQIAAALEQPREKVQQLLDELSAEYSKPGRGLTVREVAGGYKMTTRPEHHEAIRAFVKNLKPPLKLSLAALETLAVIAYKQPITSPEIMEIRGVQGAGVLKTLLDRKLITTAGRKAVIGKPILYKTTREFLIQFGLKDLGELPTLKEFEELARLALVEPEPEPAAEAQPSIPFAEVEALSEPEAPAPQPPAEPASDGEAELPPGGASEAS